MSVNFIDDKRAGCEMPTLACCLCGQVVWRILEMIHHDPLRGGTFQICMPCFHDAATLVPKEENAAFALADNANPIHSPKERK